MGKDQGDDLVDGKMTLPLIYTYQNSEPRIQEIIKNAIHNGSKDDLTIIAEAAEQSGALEKCHQFAEKLIEKSQQALIHLPKNAYYEGLNHLCHLAITRTA